MPPRPIKPPARLEPRDERERRVSDAHTGMGKEITYEQLKSVSIFKDVNYDRIDLRGLPGTIVLRHYEAAQDICVQDEPGYTAFYVLTAKEVADLKLPALAVSTSASEHALSVIREVSSGGRDRQQTLRDEVPMDEGELFGEMSCFYRVPRSATVRTTRACYALEFLSNVLDKINSGSFRKKLDEIYRKRVFELHVRRLELFRNLSYAAYVQLRDRAELLPNFVPGQLIFDEHDRPDGLYIIRTGFVKIIKNVSALLGKDSIADQPAFYAALVAGSKETGARRKLWDLALKDRPDLACKLASTEAPTLSEVERRDLLYALNDLLKKKDFAAQIGFDFAGQVASWADEAKQLAAAKKEDPSKTRRFNRLLLEALFPRLLVPYGTHPPRVLAYRSSPTWISAAAAATASDADSSLIGEIGMADDAPRSATCIAYGQSDDRYGGALLVFVNKELYTELINPTNQQPDQETQAKRSQADSSGKTRVREVAETRKEETKARMSLSVWQQESISRQFDELGLIQGQKLMLIDLDRCTRCDKCVEACVTSHSPPGVVGNLIEKLLPFDWNPLRNTGPRDGRSRLFLEGPRFQVHEGDQVKNYLVPSTCRQCKDPVCLIGCPVGSIHKGQNGQIVIEDWCIGCSKCSGNCPYNSIQMHMVGVISRGTFGWLHRQGKGPALLGSTPFRDTRDFRACRDAEEPIEFTYSFELSDVQTSKSKTFMLHIESAATDVTATINGAPIKLSHLDDYEVNRDIRWNWKTMLAHDSLETPPMLPGEDAPQNNLRTGRNEIAIQLSMPRTKQEEVILDVGLTGYVLPVVDKTVAGEDYKQEWVMKSAVVCDMCSGQFGQQPACVTACPHEAAERKYITYDAFLPVGKK